jgi:hypothetical protein
MSMPKTTANPAMTGNKMTKMTKTQKLESAMSTNSTLRARQPTLPFCIHLPLKHSLTTIATMTTTTMKQWNRTIVKLLMENKCFVKTKYVSFTTKK